MRGCCSASARLLRVLISREAGRIIPNVKKYEYNPQRAKDLLAEAGWRDSDGDGLLDRDGKPFSFMIVTNQGNDQRIKAGEIIQRRLGEIGIEVKLRVIEWGLLPERVYQSGQF